MYNPEVVSICRFCQYKVDTSKVLASDPAKFECPQCGPIAQNNIVYLYRPKSECISREYFSNITDTLGEEFARLEAKIDELINILKSKEIESE